MSRSSRKSLVRNPARREDRHSVKPQRMARRTFLRGTLGGIGISIGLPVLDVMLDGNGAALAQGGAVPVRFGTFFWGCGVVHSEWVPRQTGMTWTAPDSLVPFTELGLQPYLTVVSGTCHTDSRPGHAPACGIALSSSHDMTRTDGFRGQNHPEPSIDAIVAEAWEGTTHFDSIQVSIVQKHTASYVNCTSWRRGGTAKNRNEPSPQALYERLFGTGDLPTNTPAPGDTRLLDATVSLRRSMLDTLLDDVSSLKGRVSMNDRLRLDQHLEGLRAIERQLQMRNQTPTGGGAGCMQPPAPGSRDFNDGTDHEEKEAKSQIMSQLVATALACDLTRVFTYEWSGHQSKAEYPELGIGLSGDNGHHSYSHFNGERSEMKKITRFIMQNFAYLAKQLEQMPEGGGNVLDNTLIYATSEHSNANFHNYFDFPILYVGKAGGRVRAGQHYRDPRPGNPNEERNAATPPNRNAPKAMLTAIRAVGVPVATIGHGDSDGPRTANEEITELLT